MKKIVKISFNFLIKNKKRTGMSLIGVLLSVVLISSVLFLKDTYNTYNNEINLYTNGKWLLMDSTNDEIHLDETLKKAPIKDKLIVSELGISPLDNDMYIEILGYSNFNDIYPVHLISGNYPKNDNEIIVTESYLIEQKLAIGSKIELEIGNRVGSDGFKEINYNNSFDFIEGETYQSEGTKEYIIAGTYNDITMATISTAIKYRFITKEFDNSINTTTYYTINKINGNEWDNIKSGISEMGRYCINETAVDLYVDKGFHFSLNLSLSLIIIIVLLALNMVGLIKNTFNITLKERAFTLGTLQCIGATPRQISYIVIIEAFILGLVAIPIGLILCSLFLMFMYQRCSELMIIETGIPIDFRLIVDPMNILMISVFVYAILLFSAWWPTRDLVESSPIELAKRGIQVQQEDIFEDKRVKKRVSIEATIGSRNSKMNKKAHKMIIFSLSMSIILFISGNYLINGMITSLYQNHQNDMTIEVGLENASNKNQLNNMLVVKDELFDLNKDGESKMICNMSTPIKIPEKYLDKQYKEIFKRFGKNSLNLKFSTFGNNRDKKEKYIHVNIDNYIQYQKKNKDIVNIRLLNINVNDLMIIPYKYVSENTVKNDNINITVDNINEKSITERTYYEDDMDFPSIDVNMTVNFEDYHSFLALLDGRLHGITSFNKLILRNDDHNALIKKLNAYKEANPSKIEYIYDSFENTNEPAIIYALRIIFNMFSLFILFICIMNIVNTVLSSVISRKK